MVAQAKASDAPTCAVCRTALQPRYTAMAVGFEILSCPTCGTLRTWPDVADDDIAGFYPSTYYGEGNRRFHASFEAITRLMRRQRAADIAKRATPGPVLDVGCGRGITLAALRDLGFQPFGIELSDVSARHARDVLGLDVRTDLHDDGLKPGTFSAVIFWHSLEHIREPARAIARAKELLKPGGLLVVAVPNAESLQATLFKSKWFHLDVPRHYHHFPLRAVKQLVTDHGFTVEEMRHLNLEQNPYGAMQSMMNTLGFEENFLYSMLKTPSARGHNLREKKLHVALTVLLAPAAGVASLGLALTEALVGRGGTIEMFARKS